MSQDETVAVVLVTYNRKKLLLECLEGILRQSRLPNAIHIIDNASSDGTPQLLQERGFLDALPPERIDANWNIIKTMEDGLTISYTRMVNNTGGAGGFHEGMKQAHHDGHDWIWVMDDDVEPVPEALEVLLEYRHISDCIHPMRMSRSGEPVLWEGYIDAMTGHRVNLGNISFNNGKEFSCVNVACFEGMLIHGKIVSRIGYPDERFFIGYDDTVYGLLASQYTNVIILGRCLMIKKIIKTNDLSEFSAYYFIRNLFLQKRYIDSVFTLYTTSRNVFFLLELAWLYVKTLRSIGLRGFRVILKGTIDGMRLKRQ